MRCRDCNPDTILSSCFGRLLDLIFRLAWLSTMVTSMSAMTAWFPPTVSAMDTELSLTVELVEYCGKVKNSEKGAELPASPFSFSF